MKLTATTSLATNDKLATMITNAIQMPLYSPELTQSGIGLLSELLVIMLLLYYPSVKENVLLCFLPRLLLFKSTDAQTETPRQHLCLEQLELNVLLITASERKKATDLCGAPFSK